MSRRPTSQFLIAAATVIAVAAVSTFLIVWSIPYPGGWGVPVAKQSEVWSQRLLPGGWPVEFVEPSWMTEESLDSSDRVRYDARPHGTIHVCLPFAIFSLLIGLGAAVVHLTLCTRVNRVCETGEPMPRLAIRSAICAAWIPLFMCTVYWLWAGASRGAITQRVVGRTYVDIAFGPYGRFAVLISGLLLYVAVVIWAARALRAAGPVGSRRALRSRPPVMLLTTAVMLLLFPYWCPLLTRVVGQQTATSVAKWSRDSVLHEILEHLAPLP